MFQVTELFTKALEERKIRFNAAKVERAPKEDHKELPVIVQDMVDIIVLGDNDLKMKVRFLFDESGITASGSIIDVYDVPQDKLPAALSFINQINAQCRGAKYLVTPIQKEDNKVSWVMSCRMDLFFMPDQSDVVIVCSRALEMLAKIGNTFYPRIVKELEE